MVFVIATPLELLFHLFLNFVADIINTCMKNNNSGLPVLQHAAY